MTRTMWDGVNSDAAAIRKLAKPGDLIAYYVDGHFAWSSSDIGRFPDCGHVTITVNGSSAADVCDCETGDLTPSSSASWVRRRRAQGYYRPTIYCSTSVIPAVREATGELVLGKDYDIWDAHYDNRASSDYAGVAAKQFKNSAQFDESVVFDASWPHRVSTTSPTIEAPVLTAPKWPAGASYNLHNVGNGVMALQQALHNSEMYGVRGIKVDGGFGTQTQTAVRNFQDAEELTVDGIAGPATRSKMIQVHLLNAAGQANQ